MDSTNSIFLTSLLTCIGFFSRYFWERYISKVENKKKIKENGMDNKLNKFYYPLYFNLCKLSHLWDIIEKEPSTKEEIILECIKIHDENENIINEKIVIAKPIPKVFNDIQKYIRHITLFKTIYKLKLSLKLNTFEAEYPDFLKNTIKNRIKELEKIYS